MWLKEIVVHLKHCHLPSKFKPPELSIHALTCTIIAVLTLATSMDTAVGVVIEDSFKVVETVVGQASVILPCEYQTTSSDPSIIVRWYKGDINEDVRLALINTQGTLTSLKGFKGRVSRVGKASLRLVNPAVSDTGNVTCSVIITTDVPPIADAVIYLIVTSPSYKVNYVPLLIILVFDSLVIILILSYQLYGLKKSTALFTKGRGPLRIILETCTLLMANCSLVLVAVLLAHSCIFSRSGVTVEYVFATVFCVLSVLYIITIPCQHLWYRKAAFTPRQDISSPGTSFLTDIGEREAPTREVAKGQHFDLSERIKCQTEFILSAWDPQDEPFAERAKSVLDQEGKILITGNPGDGKTALGNYLLMQCQREGYESYMVHSPTEWKSCWEPSKRQSFLIDDCFGVISLDFKMAEKWLRVNYMLKASTSNSKYIFVSSILMYRRFLEAFNGNDVFNSKIIVDMRAEDSTPLLVEEKYKTK